MKQRTKYTDYTPDRKTRTIQQEMAMIQAVGRYSERNRKRKARLSDVGYKLASVLLYATCAASIVYLAVSIYRK